jgi:hypothetical protein
MAEPQEGLRALCFVGQLPRQYGAGSAGMVEQDRSDCAEPLETDFRECVPDLAQVEGKSQSSVKGTI